jgi:hypothetical protein
VTIFYAGDDQPAKESVRKLITDLGFDAVDAGRRGITVPGTALSPEHPFGAGLGVWDTNWVLFTSAEIKNPWAKELAAENRSVTDNF